MPQQITLFEHVENRKLGGRLGGGRRQFDHRYDDIISVENLCLAWNEFVRGKRKKRDVQEFGERLMDRIVELHESLVNQSYRHGPYQSFYITDPKRRHIHKASVRDRLLHHAVYRVLYPFFDRTFIADSYSCRNDKGMHRAMDRFRSFAYQASRNHRRTVWALKCDIKQFFASINHDVLMALLEERISDQKILWLLQNIINSYHTASSPGNGLPLGNLTSQLFSNIFLAHFDTWIKHALRASYYVRYADDFVLFSCDRAWLAAAIPQIRDNLRARLGLTLHPNKIILKTIASGVDFLGWVHFSDHRVLRTKTKQRIYKKLKTSCTEASLQSYLGMVSHGNAIKIRSQLLYEYWMGMSDGVPAAFH